jgi:type 1 glutamine amidotransferase
MTRRRTGVCRGHGAAGGPFSTIPGKHMGRIPAILLSTALAFLAGAQQPPRRREVTPEERRKIEAALPAKAPVKPKSPRKLLVVDYGGSHPSVPDADLAVELMGAKTGAYEAVISHDTSLLQADQLKNFDAVYLNNTVGVSNDVFRPELREGFAAFIRNGGGLVANHGSSVASPNWPEFTEILGATGAAHRAADEKVTLKLDDPAHPLNAVFRGRGFEFTDEIFRFKWPSPRKRVHVLFSIDVAKTDMNQGRCTSNCDSEDGEFPLSWVHSYGKGRVYYCALGHNADVFQDPRILEQFLAGIQFALGDLDADTTPTAGLSITELDTLLGRIQTYEHGQSRAALVQLTWFVIGSPGSTELLRDIEAHI